MQLITDYQNILLTTQELETRGLSRANRRRKLTAGEIIAVRAGIFAPRHWWKQLSPSGQYLARIIAYHKAARTPPIFSHDSAVALHGLINLAQPTTVHISSPRKNHSKAQGVIHHQLRHLTHETAYGIAFTPVIDTVTACAKIWPLYKAIALADSALYTGADPHQLTQALTSLQGPGSARASLVAQRMSAKSESAGESITRLFLEDHGFPPPAEQVTLQCGGYTYRPDFLWWDYMIILEFDGNIKYTHYGDREQVFKAQNEREARLRAQGFTVVRTSWDEVMQRPYSLRAKLEEAFSISGKKVIRAKR